MPTRAGRTIGTRARATVSVHCAPIVLPVCGPPVRDGAIVVRNDRIARVGPRAEIVAAHPLLTPVHWPGMIVPGLIDAHLRLDRAAAPVSAYGVTAAGGIAADLDAASTLGEAGLGGVTYLETRCEDEDRWEDEARDRLITAIREVDHPGVIGIAAHSSDPVVMEDLTVLSRTFGLRLHVEPGRHTVAFLDEVGALDAGCHIAISRPLDEADRKLLRARGTVVAISSPFAADGLLDGESAIAIGTRTGGDPLAVARALSRAPEHDRLLVEAVTRGGARALGMDEGPGRLGCLDRGGRADFAVFAVEAGERDPYTVLLHEGPGRCVATFVGGRASRRPGETARDTGHSGATGSTGSTGGTRGGGGARDAGDAGDADARSRRLA
ncbi:imidazolonepropionase-like domain-containing protein [Streptosporangium longisporum]|uniref:Aminodeoxyfutalosine deaminase/Imidazolonepropionase-like composite domain-containing protein n=1 Tax=Streptosporangium longisporum TaxID=46187 RepID=A0ABP6KYE7_9ACTN